MKRSVVFALAACAFMYCESSNPTSGSRARPTAFDNSSFSGTYTYTNGSTTFTFSGKIGTNGKVTELINEEGGALQVTGQVSPTGAFSVKGSATGGANNVTLTYSGTLVLSSNTLRYTGSGTFSGTLESSGQAYSGTWIINTGVISADTTPIVDTTPVSILKLNGLWVSDTNGTAATILSYSTFSSNGGNSFELQRYWLLSSWERFSYWHGNFTVQGTNKIRLTGVREEYLVIGGGTQIGTLDTVLDFTAIDTNTIVIDSVAYRKPHSSGPITLTGSYLGWTASDDTARAFKLVRINGTTGSVSVIGGTGFFTQLVYGPDGSLYGIASTLCKINPQTAATTLVGDLKLPGASSSILMAGAEFSPSGVLYVVSNMGDSVFTVNTGTGVLMYVGKASVSVRDVAINKQGTMYGGTAALVMLNPTTAATQSTVGTGMYLGGPMFFDAAGALLKNDVFPSTKIYSINLSTAQATSILTIGSTGIVALVQEKSSLSKVQSRDEGPVFAPDRDYLIKLEQAYKNGISKVDF